VTVDLEDIGAACAPLPWVDSAAVQRSWPRGLKVDIIEQTAVARWNESGLVNARGSCSRARRASCRRNCRSWQGPPARRRKSRALSWPRRDG
jgi:cell division septal protein FtsQ